MNTYIYVYIFIIYKYLSSGPKPAPVFSFLNQNYEWMKEEVARQANRSAYWRNVGKFCEIRYKSLKDIGWLTR